MNGSRAAALATVAAAVLWGTTGTAAAFAPALGPLLIGAVAMGGGGILQAVVNAGALRRERRALHDRLSVTALGALCVVIYPLAFYTSMHVGGVALGTVVSLASAPLASAVIERVADARPISRRWAASCALGVAGCALLCVSRSAGTGGNVVAGVLLGLAAGAAYAGYSWSMRRLMAHDISRGAAAGAVLGGGGVVLAAGAVAGGASLAAAPPSSWAVLAYLAVVPMFGGYVLFSRGLAGIDATTATTLTLLEPAVATVLAVGVLGETLAASGWTGMALLLVAQVVLVSPRGRPRPTRHDRPTRNDRPLRPATQNDSSLPYPIDH
ncbi:DMT family transporter [Gordonia sp. (in: high G+C Gram-positive bacteria)]|uniref:DMT family transporter n=1 Tax=Gordonia sp. (in: high G+C Gram-positive bacteria) TaxID=84139 RepID=UPI003528BBEF